MTGGERVGGAEQHCQIAKIILWEEASDNQKDGVICGQAARYISSLGCKVPLVVRKRIFQMSEEGSYEAAKAAKAARARSTSSETP